MHRPVLTAAQLSRATLARQLLLERAQLDPTLAIERLVALQAQEPASPHIALWSRLAGYRAADLNDAFDARRVVKGTLLRVTLHAVSARDYLSFWPAVQPSLQQWRSPIIRQLALEPDLQGLAAQAAAFGREPRTGKEMREHLPSLATGIGPGGQTDAWWAIRPLLPFLMAPGEPPWSFGRRPRFVAAPAWLEAELVPSSEGLDHLIRRYLTGFGPAGVDDLHQFTRVATSGLRLALARLDDELVSFEDERGRVLYDVPGGLLPPGDLPAPVRFLPMWDSLLLAYRDRSRVLPEPYRRRVIQPNGDFLPSFMVDGLVAGLWRADVIAGRTRITPLPFEPLATKVDAQVAAEANRLAEFLEPLDPAVYSRYATTWMKGTEPRG
jgi:hypothetical protein